MRFNHRFHLSLICTAVLFTGCQKDGIHTNEVQGTVHWNNQPVVGATVSFNPLGGGASNCLAVGTTDEQGNYRLSSPSGEFGAGAVAGSYNVTVSKIPAGVHGRPSKATELPGVYAETATTPLKAEVVAGKNKFDFTLEGTAPPKIKPVQVPSGPATPPVTGKSH